MRLKHRLRGIPVLGTVLVRLNAWQRQHGLRHKIHHAPGLGAGVRWAKSLALLTRTRHRAHIAEETARLVREELQSHRAGERLAALENQNAALQRRNEDFSQQVEDLKRQNADLSQQIENLTASVHERPHWADLRPLLEEMKGEYRGREEELSSLLRHFGERLGRLANRADLLHGDVLFQQRRLDTLVGNQPRTSAASDGAPDDTASEPLPAATEAHVSDRLANVYEAFEDHFRGSREEIKQRQTVYLDTIRTAGAGTETRPILDIGCGRGEWLELLKDHGLAGRGIDINEIAIETCRENGLDARVQDMFAALHETRETGLGAVTAFHVIEHMEMETLVDFLDAARTALAPDGLLILETPNPENLIVGATTFHNDPTHKAPIPPSVARFLVEQRGFADAEIRRLHPMPESERLPGDDPVSDRLNTLLYGPQDYAIVARRP